MYHQEVESIDCRTNHTGILFSIELCCGLYSFSLCFFALQRILVLPSHAISTTSTKAAHTKLMVPMTARSSKIPWYVVVVEVRVVVVVVVVVTLFMSHTSLIIQDSDGCIVVVVLVALKS